MNKKRLLAAIAVAGTLMTVASPIYANTTTPTSTPNTSSHLSIAQGPISMFGFLPDDPDDEE